MSFLARVIIFSITIWVTLFLFREYPGNLTGGQKAGFGYLAIIGSFFYFMAPYMDALALMSRRGSEASPNNTSEKMWQYLGLFGIIFAYTFIVIRQVW